MRNGFINISIGLFLALNPIISSQTNAGAFVSVKDGPYIFVEGDTIKVKWISNNRLKEESLDSLSFEELRSEFDLRFDYDYMEKSFRSKPDFIQNHTNVDSIFVLSDVHGEYSVYLNLLKNMGVIDEDLNWKFGKGHLVLLGDVFDRGAQVTELLWHLFGLEKQALEAGGMVHFLLGNHELMVLGNDLRYINKKYGTVEMISGISYTDLFSGNSVLGNWIRTRPVVITINDIIFVHGGISIDVVRRGLSLKQINRMFYEDITGREVVRNNSKNDQQLLNDDLGPVWYRGYFTDPGFTEVKADSILNFYDKKHIVVGHTTLREIFPRYDKKIIGVDAGISLDKPGQMLIFKDGSFYKASSSEERIKL